MALSRRKFIKTSILAGISAAPVLLKGEVAFGQKGGVPAPSDSLSRLSRKDFYECQSTMFQVTGRSKQVELELYSVDENTSNVSSSGECFSMSFRGVHEGQLRQGIYRFSHKQLGVFDLFITPGGIDGRMYYYNATINRLSR